jgi:hypothetical protein
MDDHGEFPRAARFFGSPSTSMLQQAIVLTKPSMRVYSKPNIGLVRVLWILRSCKGALDLEIGAGSSENAQLLQVPQ